MLFPSTCEGVGGRRIRNTKLRFTTKATTKCQNRAKRLVSSIVRAMVNEVEQLDNFTYTLLTLSTPCSSAAPLIAKNFVIIANYIATANITTTNDRIPIYSINIVTQIIVNPICNPQSIHRLAFNSVNGRTLSQH